MGRHMPPSPLPVRRACVHARLRSEELPLRERPLPPTAPSTLAPPDRLARMVGTTDVRYAAAVALLWTIILDLANRLGRPRPLQPIARAHPTPRPDGGVDTGSAGRRGRGHPSTSSTRRSDGRSPWTTPS